MTTISEIKSFKFKKGNGYKPKGMSHLPRECPIWGRKCHKCGNKNHFSTCCRSKQKGPRDSSKQPSQDRRKSKGRKGEGKPSRSRSRSVSPTHDAHSIESSSFQDHLDDPYGDSEENLHGGNSFQDHQESTAFVKKMFHTVYRSRLVASISKQYRSRGQNQDPHHPTHQAAPL